jgi:uncharacterized membrane protein YphA (DoxX/SURF4 family)
LKAKTEALVNAVRVKQRRAGEPGVFLERGVRLVLAAIFLISGITKLAEPQSFAVIIDAYGIIPEALAMPAALLLAVLEIVAATGLVLKWRGSLELMTGLMLIFMAVLAYGIHLGLDVDCGCFGPEDPEAKAFHGLQGALLRDLGLMVAIFYLYGRRHLTTRGAGRRNRVDSRRKRCV